MIEGFKSIQPLEPTGGMQWGPAVGSGLIAGVVLLIVPHGSPWEALTFFSPDVMGRNLSASGLPMFAAWGCHLLVGILYGLVISRAVANLKQGRAILMGGLVGLLLYGINLSAFSAFWPRLRGNEVAVVLTHIVFGLVAAGAYRGLLRRSSGPAETT